jgi:CRISPR type III-associated protein (TIGR04423 family)
MKKNREEIIKYINNLKGYQGYVQFSHRPINKIKDIFIDKNPNIEDESGFIYEAHFFNGKASITIKQVNNSWLVDEVTNTPLDDTQTYLSDIKDFDYKIKMAQIWESKPDNLCEDMEVMKLQKVVFVGFKNG